ncbi:MAG: UPF0149 family protein [Acidiferrobacterales bacterium]
MAIETKAESEKVDHDALARVLEKVDSDTSAAEAHGVISGVLCVSSDDQAGSKWVPILLSDAAQMAPEAAKKLSLALMYIHQNTLNALKSGDFTFDLMVPDDDKPVAERIEALADWCRGYLLGLSVHGQAGEQSLAAQKKEFVEDLIEISNVQSGLENDENAENNLMELHEFVRVGVQTVFDESQPDPVLDIATKKPTATKH